MLNMVTYILTFVIIAFVLISAVIVHLLFGFHRRVVLKWKRKESDDKHHRTLHETIFQGHKTIGRDDETPPTLHETIFR